MTEPMLDENAAETDASADARRTEHMGVGAAVIREIREGMSREQKQLSPRFFYDRRGSELFERITALPEYYLTRTERALLESWMPQWIGGLRPRALVELGAGSADKTRIVLDEMAAHDEAPVYVPVDVSAEFLQATARLLRVEYPALEVRPAVADISTDFALGDGLPGPVLYAFLGSTIGNFDSEAAVRLLRNVRAAMHGADRFLLGVDLRKDPTVIEAAYNDAEGVTAEFNRNMLRVMNHDTGADFDPDAWEHRAFYDRDRHRIEMHLVAGSDQRVTIPGAGSWTVAAGESIRTEISCKHDRASVASLFDAAGLGIERWQTDEGDRYALVLGSAAG